MLVSRAFEDDDGTYQLEVHNTVTFVDRDGTTALTLDAEVVKASDDVAGPLGGMEIGWRQSFDKLAEYVADAPGDGPEAEG